MSEHALLIIIVLIDSVGILLSLYLHRRDSHQQEYYRDEEIEVLNQIADAVNPQEVEAVEEKIDENVSSENLPNGRDHGDGLRGGHSRFLGSGEHSSYFVLARRKACSLAARAYSALRCNHSGDRQ